MAPGDWRYAIPLPLQLFIMVMVLMQDRIWYTLGEGGNRKALGRRGYAGVLSPLPVVVLRAEVEMHE